MKESSDSAQQSGRQTDSSRHGIVVRQGPCCVLPHRFFILDLQEPSPQQAAFLLCRGGRQVFQLLHVLFGEVGAASTGGGTSLGLLAGNNLVL